MRHQDKQLVAATLNQIILAFGVSPWSHIRQPDLKIGWTYNENNVLVVIKMCVMHCYKCCLKLSFKLSICIRDHIKKVKGNVFY